MPTPSGAAFALLTVGFCGAYTTVSTFSVQTVDLLERGRSLHAAVNAGASAVVCLVAMGAAFFAVGGDVATMARLAEARW